MLGPGYNHAIIPGQVVPLLGNFPRFPRSNTQWDAKSVPSFHLKGERASSFPRLCLQTASLRKEPIMSEGELTLLGVGWMLTLLIAYLVGEAKGWRDGREDLREEIEDLSSLLGEGGTD